MIERYAVYWVDLDPTGENELSKRRPAVVISDEEMNASLKTVVVCPLTTRLHPRWPSRVRVEVAVQSAEVACDQVRTVSRSRLSEHMGRIDEEAAAAVRHVITEMYGALSVRAE